MIRHFKWHKKRDESLQHGFMRYSPIDDCTEKFGPCTHNGRQTHYHCLQVRLMVQTGLGDPSSNVPSSSTSVMVLMGTDLPNVFLLLCSVIPMSVSVIKFRGRKD